MDSAYLTACAALAGSTIGGLTTLAASWVAQRAQADAQQRAHGVAVREDLYKAFIDDASKTYVDAIQRTEIDNGSVVRLYALVSRMRVLSSQRVVDQANTVMRLIMDAYRAPNRTLLEEAERMETGGLDPLLDFSEACRDELRYAAVHARRGSR